MPLMDDISAAQKEFDSVIKEVEAQKKEIDRLDSEYSKTSSDFSKEFTRAAAALKIAETSLQEWSTGYDQWISSMKAYNKEFGAYEKKCVEAEKFYNTLKDEKDERDKARKKAGAGAKPSKEDQIADAAFKRAETAYETHPGKGLQAMLKDIRGSAKAMEAVHKDMVSNLTKATAEYNKVCASLKVFASHVSNNSWKSDFKLGSNPVGSAFDSYFKQFK